MTFPATFIEAEKSFTGFLCDEEEDPLNLPDTIYYFNGFKFKVSLNVDITDTTELSTDAAIVSTPADTQLFVLDNPFANNPLVSVTGVLRLNDVIPLTSTNYWRKVNGASDKIYVFDQIEMYENKIYNVTFSEVKAVDLLRSYSVSSNRIGITWEVPLGANVFKVQFSSIGTSEFITITETLSTNRYVLSELSPESPYTFR